jgi:rubredoxin
LVAERSRAIDIEKGKFICPECGSKEADTMALISPIFVPGNPWSFVLQTITCVDCGSEVPAHLAERWNGMTKEQARSEWEDVYRPTRET